MRTTLDLPEKLVDEAMRITKSRTKTELIKNALEGIIVRENIRDLKGYYGKVDLDIDLDTLRKR